MATVGIVSPGAMGSAVADALVRGGARVVATTSGRSDRTQRLAARTRVELLENLRAVVRESDVVVSIVPPGAATDVDTKSLLPAPKPARDESLPTSTPSRRRRHARLLSPPSSS